MITPLEQIRRIVERDDANELATINAYEDTYRRERERDDYRERIIPELVWLIARHLAAKDTDDHAR